MCKLAEFIIDDMKKESMHFITYGDFKTERSLVNEEFPVPIFSNLKMTKIEKGTETSFIPYNADACCVEKGYCFAMANVIEMLTRNDETIRILYLDEKIQKLINEYQKEIKFEYNGKKITRYIYSKLKDLAELVLATEQFLYYFDGECFIMLRTENGNCVAEGSFAEIGLNETYEDVQNGKDKILYGEIESFFEHCNNSSVENVVGSVENEADFEELPFIY